MKYWDVVAYTFGEIPEAVELEPVDEELPFQRLIWLIPEKKGQSR